MHLLEKPIVAMNGYRVTAAKSPLRSNARKAIVLAVILCAALRIEVQARAEPYSQIASIGEHLMKDRGPESWRLTFLNS
jgi:hypothetical protein